MPIRRSRRPTRRPRISRVVMARRRVRGGGYRRNRQPIHYFKRTCKISDITASWNAATATATTIAGTYALSLDSVSAHGEFTSLYDQYMIRAVKLSFVPSGNSYMTSTVSGIATPVGFSRFNSVIDYNDSSVPANENEMLQYQSLKTTPGYKTHTRYFKPKVQQTIADNDVTGTVVNGAPKGNCWLDCANPSVDHLGLKVFCAAPINSVSASTSVSITYSVYATFYLAFKNVR